MVRRGVVAEIADRVIVMRRGEKVKEGSVFPIFGTPQHECAHALLVAAPTLGSLSGQRLPTPFPDARGAVPPPQDMAPRPERRRGWR